MVERAIAKSKQTEPEIDPVAMKAERAKRLAELDANIDQPKPAPIMPISADTVTVACKLPNGIRMRIFKMETVNEQAPGGAREVQRSRQVGQTIVVRGPATPFGVIPSEPIIGGYALTRNVPRDFWETWLDQNMDQEFVQKGLIFARDKAEDASAKAKERASIKSGLEPIDPTAPPDISLNKNVKLTAANAEDFKA